MRLRTHRKGAAAASDTVAPEVYPVETTADDSADHALHVNDEVCARCGRPFKPTDEARRTAKGDCVHISC